MARQKNALRKHEIAPYDGEEEVPTSGWLPFGKNITSITDESEEKTDTAGDYSGDGNEEEVLIGRSEKWKYEGTDDTDDPAQTLIRNLKRKQTDEERMIWHRVTEADGTVVVGPAKVLEIVAGGGDATEYGAFTGTINFKGTPTITSPGNGGSTGDGSETQGA